MALKGLDHVAIAVERLEPALEIYCRKLGWTNAGIEIVEEQKVRIALLTQGPHALELVEPWGAGSPVRRFLDRRGPGLHHLCFAVDRLDQALARLKADGTRLINETPRPGAHGRRIAFLHPSAANGVLIELSEQESAQDPDRTADPDKPTIALEIGEVRAAERLLTPSAVAELHGVPESTVRAAIAAGSLVAQAVHGPSGADIAGYVVRRSDALAWRPAR